MGLLQMYTTQCAARWEEVSCCCGATTPSLPTPLELPAMYAEVLLVPAPSASRLTPRPQNTVAAGGTGGLHQLGADAIATARGAAGGGGGGNEDGSTFSPTGLITTPPSATGNNPGLP